MARLILTKQTTNALSKKEFIPSVATMTNLN